MAGALPEAATRARIAGRTAPATGVAMLIMLACVVSEWQAPPQLFARVLGVRTPSLAVIYRDGGGDVFAESSPPTQAAKTLPARGFCNSESENYPLMPL